MKDDGDKKEKYARDALEKANEKMKA